MQYPNYKVKILDWKSNAGGYGGVPINFDDPRSQEPLVSLTKRGIAADIIADEKTNDKPQDMWCRRGVADKLLNVNASLKSFDVEIFVLDAYRSIDVQKSIWTSFEADALQKMPNSSDEELRNYVLQFVSDPTRFDRNDSKTWPVHSSGGAIDLTLRKLDGELLDMGASLDEASNESYSDMLERKLLNGSISSDNAALNNRRLLHWAMEQEGFVNYPLEFWHFDFGDQMYIHTLTNLGVKAPTAAWYGYIDPPTKSEK